MEAGIEHLTRGTAKGVDKLIIVVEPGMRSVATGRRVRDLALEIGLQNIGVVGNKVRSTKDQDFLTSKMPDFEFLGFIPYDEAIVEADIAGLPLVDSSPRVMTEVRSIAARLAKSKQPGERGQHISEAVQE
jgi:CO dehydrogenase maturation factor